MSDAPLTAVSVLEAVLLILVLALALIKIRVRLTAIARSLAALAEGVGAVEQDLRLIAVAVPQVNAPLHDIVGALPAIAQMAETLADAER